MAAQAVAVAAAVDDHAKVDTSNLSTWGKVKNWLLDYSQAGHVDPRTPPQLEREKWLFFTPNFGPRFNRFYLLLPVLAIQICAGSLYSFSIFNADSDYNYWQPQGYKSGANANAFTIAVAFFGYGAAIFGPWISRWGPWYAVRNAVLLIPAGWAFACLGTYTKTLWVLYAGFGICLGLGGAMAYISTCSMIQQHFPEFKASATGYAVMGFGVGSTIWTNVGNTLMTSGYTVSQIQGIFAAVFLCGLALSWNFMRPPQPGYKSPLIDNYGQEKSVCGCLIRTLATNPKSKTNFAVTTSMRLVDAMRSMEMFLLTIMVVGQFVAGVVFISSASNMAQNIFGLTKSEGATVTSYLTIANFLGRVGWGFISDKIGRKTFYLLATSSQAFALGCMIVWIEQINYNMWLTSFLIVGTMYGGGFGVLPAFVSDLFGSKISGATHGLMLAVWATTSIVGTPIFTSINAATAVPKVGCVITATNPCSAVPQPSGYITNAKWMCVLPAISFLALLFLNVRPRDRELRRATGAIRIRLWCLVAVFSCLKNPEQQDVEWEKYQEQQAKKAANAAATLEGATKEAGLQMVTVTTTAEGAIATSNPVIIAASSSVAAGAAKGLETLPPVVPKMDPTVADGAV